jgi:hypothetical protein
MTKKITIYRVGSEASDLDNRNAANLEGIIKYLEQQDRRGIAHGDHITRYELEVSGEYGPYVQYDGQRGVGEMVGRSEEGSEAWPSAWYSIPKGQNYRVTKTVSLEEINKAVTALEIDNGFGRAVTDLVALGWVQQREILEAVLN